MYARSRFLLLLLGMVLVTCSGCVSESESGSARIFTYQLWVPLSVLLGGLASAPVGWVLRQNRYGWVFLVLGPLAAIVLAPTLFLERSVVDNNTFSIRSGIWGMTSKHQVDLSKLKQVTITTEETRGRRGRKSKNTYLVCQNEDGSTSKLPANNDVTRAAAAHFLQTVEQRGVPVIDQQF